MCTYTHPQKLNNFRVIAKLFKRQKWIILQVENDVNVLNEAGEELNKLNRVLVLMNK